MADNKFKTAAAKLLAVHESKETGKPVRKKEAVSADIPPKKPQETPPAIPVIVWKPRDSSKQSAERPALPSIESLPDGEEASDTRPLAGKRLLVVLPALLGGCLAVVLLSPTIIGTLGNFALGLFGGAAFGYIIAKEL